MLSTLAFEVLWEALELPVMPARIAVDQHGADDEERRRFVERADAELARHGLGSVRQVPPRLANLLGVLARHDRGLGWRELVGARRRAYLAVSGSVAAQAVVIGDEVRVVRRGANHMIGSLLELVPHAQPGAGRAFSVPTAIYQQAVRLAVAGKGTLEQRSSLREAGVRADQAEQLELLSRTTVNTGSISVHRRRRGEVKAAGSLAYTGTTRGRYLILQRPDRGGANYTSIVPADGKVLRHHIAELMGTAVAW